MGEPTYRAAIIDLQDGIDFTNFDDHDFAAVFRLQDVDQLVATAKAFELGFETLLRP